MSFRTPVEVVVWTVRVLTADCTLDGVITLVHVKTVFTASLERVAPRTVVTTWPLTDVETEATGRLF